MVTRMVAAVQQVARAGSVSAGLRVASAVSETVRASWEQESETHAIRGGGARGARWGRLNVCEGGSRRPAGRVSSLRQGGQSVGRLIGTCRSGGRNSSAAGKFSGPCSAEGMIDFSCIISGGRGLRPTIASCARIPNF